MEKKYLSITIHTQDLKDSKSKTNKTYRSFSSQRKHNLRIEKMDSNYLLNSQKKNENIHYEKYKENFDLDSLFQKVQNDYKDYHKRKLPSNTKKLINGLITFSDTMQEDIYKYDRDKLFKVIGNFIKLEFGIVINLHLHMDETTPHFHFCSLNYNFKEHKTHSQLMKNSLKNSKNRKNELQDRLENYIKKHIEGFDYQRGEIKSIKEYHSQRKKQHDHIQKQKEQIENQEKKLIQLQNANQKLKNKISDLKQNAEKHIEKLSIQIKDLHKEKIDIINDIINDLIELQNETNLQKFINLTNRYLKSEKKDKLEKHITKYKSKLSKKKSLKI